ncbi:MAG: hypothetical protein HY047_00480 [Acidobacteria bacterium]|nr:hypothetical protein [Acidobacteriota bacterium]
MWHRAGRSRSARARQSLEGFRRGSHRSAVRTAGRRIPATRRYHDDIRRAADLKTRGLHYVDVGTSGSVWGGERGYCLMIGGEPAPVQRLEPIFQTLAPGVDAAPATPGRARPDGTAQRGYLHCGAAGAGHFVKMVHNGIEYGMMAALAEQADLASFAGRVSDSGETRWTIAAALDEAVPVPVLSAALYARFSSRGAAAFADRVLSAMRYQFGGHRETPAEGPKTT